MPFRVLEILRDTVGLGLCVTKEILYTVSKKGNTHVYIKSIEPMDDMTKVLAQALLGSDPIREALALERVRRNTIDTISKVVVTCLFETPKEFHKVLSWRGYIDG